MWVWRKPPAKVTESISIARAAVDGKSRDDLLRETIKTLLASHQADRFGVWLEIGDDASAPLDQVLPSFRGIVAEKAGNTTPSEWSRISPEAPLPAELLLELRTVEREVDDSAGGSIIGALIEMRRALWVPVTTHGHLRGILFAGHRHKQAHLPRELLECVAAELALVLELEQERRLSGERHQNSRHIVAALSGTQSPTDILSGIVAGLTNNSETRHESSALFAAIGRLVDPAQPAIPGSHPAGNVQFVWQAGSPASIRGLDTDPLRDIWRRSLESQQVVGMEPGRASFLGERARVLAWPLQAGGQILGVLVAGIRPRDLSLAALERWELTAVLAGFALLQLKHREEASEHENQLQDLLNAVDAACVVVRADGTIERISARARTITGAEPKLSPNTSCAASVPKDFFDLFSPSEAPAVRAWLRRVQSTNQVNHDFDAVLPQAHLRGGAYARLQAAYTTSNGRAAILIQLSEPSEKIPAQEGAAEIANVIEWLEEGVVLFGADQEIRALNSRFGQMVGLSPEEFGGLKTLDDLVAMFARRMDAGNSAGSWKPPHPDAETATHEQLHLVRPVPRLLERFARPIFDQHGVQSGRVEIYRDLTAQRVFQSKLQQTEKLAELGQMVTSIAHELSNPLTSILGYAQRLLLRRDSAGDSSEARQIFQEAERASAILRQLLLSARESRPDRRRVALNQLVSRTLELQRFSLAAGNVRFQLDLDPLLPFILGDAGQLQQVLVNLLANARQAFEEQGRGGTIQLKTKRIGEKRVLLEVSDDGPGIPQAIQARIFDPFFTTKAPGLGTGLGLAIVLTIVREHGGGLHLTSSIGKGSAFSIELPAISVLEVPARREPRIPPRLKQVPPVEPFKTAHTGVLSSWRGARILVLEDEPTVARLIADVLEDEGLRVDVLLDAREALERIAQVEYALLVCDMKMPGLDGEHFYQTLVRAKSPLRHRFLFVTGDVLAARTREFLERNHLPHVAKPFRVEELTEKIRVVLESNSPREPSQVPAAKKNAARK